MYRRWKRSKYKLQNRSDGIDLVYDFNFLKLWNSQNTSYGLYATFKRQNYDAIEYQSQHYNGYIEGEQFQLTSGTSTLETDETKNKISQNETATHAQSTKENGESLREATHVTADAPCVTAAAATHGTCLQVKPFAAWRQTTKSL